MQERHDIPGDATTGRIQSDNIMKTKSLLALQLPSLAASLFLSSLSAVVAAETEKKTTVTEKTESVEEITATGTVFSVEPKLLSVVMKDNPTPVRFSYDKSTPFLDEKGTAVPMDLVRAELPLTVHYVMEGDRMVASRVVISRSMVAGDADAKPGKKREELAAEKAGETSQAVQAEKSLPQEVTGTVSTIEQTISIVPRGERNPTSCIINNSTRFVNISGQPVSPQMLTGGMPVTIKSVRDGNRTIAQEIVIRGGGEAMSGSGPGSSSGNGGSGATGTTGTTQTTGTTRNNSSGGANNLNDIQPVQGFVLPGQAPGQVGSGSGNPGNRGIPGQGNNPNQSGQPNQTGNGNQANTTGQTGNTNQPNTTGQNPATGSNTPQAGTKQPNTQPATGRPAGGTQPSTGTSGNNSGTGNSTSGGQTR